MAGRLIFRHRCLSLSAMGGRVLALLARDWLSGSERQRGEIGKSVSQLAAGGEAKG